MADTATTETQGAAEVKPVNLEALVDKNIATSTETAGTVQPEAAPVQAKPSWKDIDFDGDDVPEFIRGKKGTDVLKWANDAQELARTRQSERDRLAHDLNQLRIEKAAREAVQAAIPPAPKPEPQADPRQAQLDEHLLTGNMAAYRELRDQIDEERIAAATKRVSEETEQRVLNTLKAQRGQEQGETARVRAFAKLKSMGVPEEQLNDYDLGVGLYSAITRKPTPDAPNPYWERGGPLNENVIVAAWQKMYGVPAAPAPVAEPVPAPVPPPVARPVIAAPPGATKPAPASGPAPVVASPLRNEVKAVYETLADSLSHLNIKKDRFLERARGKNA